MKRIFAVLILLVFILVPSAVYAGGCAGFPDECFAPKEDNTGRIGSDGWEWAVGYFEDMYVDDDLTVAGDLTFGGSTQYRSVNIPLTSFLFETDTEGWSSDLYIPISSTTTPGFEEDENQPVIVWDDGEASPIEVTFQVPDDYRSTGSLRLLVSQRTPNNADPSTGTETPTWRHEGSELSQIINWTYYKHTNDTIFDTTATTGLPVRFNTIGKVESPSDDQPPAHRPGASAAGLYISPSIVTLGVASPAGTGLSAGQWLTVTIARLDTSTGEVRSLTGTQQLLLRGAYFRYLPTY